MREKIIDIITDYADFLSWETIDAIADNIIADGFTIPVRCKDCKHYFHYGNGVYGCRTFGMMKTNADGFCSYGERREGECK